MRSIVKSSALLLMLPLLMAADHDVTKLPEGSVWSGTWTVRNQKKVVFTTGVDLKITSRERNEFIGQWTTVDTKAIAEVKGTVSGNKVSFKFVREIRGKFHKGVDGSLVASGMLFVKEHESKLKGSTANADLPNQTGEWEAVLKQPD